MRRYVCIELNIFVQDGLCNKKSTLHRGDWKEGLIRISPFKFDEILAALAIVVSRQDSFGLEGTALSKLTQPAEYELLLSWDLGTPTNVATISII